MIAGPAWPRAPDPGTGGKGVGRRSGYRQAELMASLFLPGLDLSRLYYAEVIRPLLDAEFGRLAHSAALLGPGSEVLGLDSERSTDHDWGPRCLIFLPDVTPARAAGAEGSARTRASAMRVASAAPGLETGPDDPTAGLAAQVSAMLTRRLPSTFRGYRTAFPASGAAPGSAAHWVVVTGLGRWLTGMLGFDPRRGVTLLDWLATPAQRLAEVTAGAVFHDGLSAVSSQAASGGPAGSGGLAAARKALAWYPDDVWRYLLACQWQRISQEEAFPGRCAEAGDELGSAIVTARLARDMVRLVLLMRRRYPPYSKWLGSAFAQVPGVARELRPLLAGAVLAGDWPERERNLCGAYQAVARMHNELRLTGPVDGAVRPFYDRPYNVLDAGRFVNALQESIGTAQIRRLPPAGGVDQFIDSTDAVADLALPRAAVSAQLSR
jgi:hypothetical protein